MSLSVLAASLTRKAEAIATAKGRLAASRKSPRKWHRPERLWPLFTREEV